MQIGAVETDPFVAMAPTRRSSRTDPLPTDREDLFPQVVMGRFLFIENEKHPDLRSPIARTVPLHTLNGTRTVRTSIEIEVRTSHLNQNGNLVVSCDIIQSKCPVIATYVDRIVTKPLFFLPAFSSPNHKHRHLQEV